MGLQESLLSLNKGVTKKEPFASKDWGRILKSADFKKNPPVIKITHLDSKNASRYAILSPNQDVSKKESLCFNIYNEINNQFPAPCGGCSLSLKTLEEGKIKSTDGKIVALIEFAGFAKDQEHFQKTWSLILQ